MQEQLKQMKDLQAQQNAQVKKMEAMLREEQAAQKMQVREEIQRRFIESYASRPPPPAVPGLL